LRILLTNYLRDLDEPADINDLIAPPILSDRDLFDETMGLESSSMTFGEIDRLRPLFSRCIAEQSPDQTFVKVHDAYSVNDRNIPILPEDSVSTCVYIVRNPLSIAVSYAYHQNQSVEWAISRMENEQTSLFGDMNVPFPQLRQKLLSWSGHVQSWISQTAIKVHVMRYEDLLENTSDTFAKMVTACGLEPNAERIKLAVNFSTFDKTQRQEAVSGFKEKNPASQMFFRAGSIDDWKIRLTSKQISRICETHGDIMQLFEYSPS